MPQVLRDTYRCILCNHIYRQFKGNIVEYHVNSFRNRKSARRDVSEIDESGNVTELFHLKRKEIVFERMNYVRHLLKDDYECLDIGAGAGTFARPLSEEVGSVECTELSDCLLRECERLGFKTYGEDFLTLNLSQKYDIVFAWHVLEHIEDVRSFVKKLKEISRKYVVIEVPLLVALDGQGRRRTLKEPNLGNFDGHAHYFSEESFRYLFEDHFKILKIKEGVQAPALYAELEVLGD